MNTNKVRRGAGPEFGKILIMTTGKEVTLDAGEGAVSRGSLALNICLLSIELSVLHHLTAWSLSV